MSQRNGKAIHTADRATLPPFARKIRLALGEQDGRLPDGSLISLAADSGISRRALLNALVVGHAPDGAVLARICEARKVDIGWVLDDEAPLAPVVKAGDDLARAIRRGGRGVAYILRCIAEPKLRAALEREARRIYARR